MLKKTRLVNPVHDLSLATTADLAVDFISADKPAGLTTHTSLNDSDRKKPWIDSHDGLLEWLGVRIGETLFPIHRLDRETTGVILFARSKEAAAKAREWFESREIEKTYYFLTDHTTQHDSFTRSSRIERVGNAYISDHRSDSELAAGSPANSETHFEKVRSQGRFTLWRAKPSTGKPHQIRLHAEDAGLPLLGDSLHGGSDFPTLCLHSGQLKLPGGKSYEAPLPIYFEDLNLLDDRRLVRWLAAVDRRERTLRSVKPFSDNTSTIRWIHTEGDPLRIEQLGTVVNLNWFRDTFPTEDEWRSIEKLLRLKKWTQWYLQIRADRGRDPHTDRALESLDLPPPARWTARENTLEFEFRRETGLSPGLFLDQRRNRAWLASQIKPGESRVLNLFCYTGGFSLAAAHAGAKQTVSVDVSKPFLDWSKSNFELNGISTAPVSPDVPSAYEFRSMDAGEYLAWAAKKELKFDFIVCDPPSFARTNTRGKSSVFRIETEFESLLKGCLKVARSGTRILFSTNFEQWSLDQFAALTEKTIKASVQPRARLVPTPSPDLDFEMPRAPKNMKSLVIEV